MVLRQNASQGSSTLFVASSSNLGPCRNTLVMPVRSAVT